MRMIIYLVIALVVAGVIVLMNSLYVVTER
jgi:hypothetical protein